MRKYFHKDHLFATIFVFIVIGLIDFFPWNLHVFDPVILSFKDFDISDIYYSRIKDYPEVDPNIVVVNIGNGDRASIARQINRINQYEPRVLGVDVIFSNKKDSAGDHLLKQALEATPNLVLASFYKPGSSHTFSDIETSDAILSGNKWNYGYANLVGNETKTIRYFPPSEKTADKTIVSFDAQVAKAFDPLATEKLFKRKNAIELIRYFGSSKNFITIKSADILDSTFNLNSLKGKIVLLGYYSDETNEDKYFTPLNPEYSGRSVPDMNGVFIHANIIHMILNAEYISKISNFWVFCIAFFILYIHIAFFASFYIEHPLFYHLFAKILQLLTSILIVFISLFLLIELNIKWTLSLCLVSVVFSVDLLYFYEGFSKFLARKYQYRSFYPMHHN